MNQERVATLQTLLRMDPRDVFSCFALGLEYLDSEPEQAQAHFAQVLQLDPDYVAAYMQLGKLHIHDPAQARHWWSLGLEAARRVRDTQAAQELEEFLDELD